MSQAHWTENSVRILAMQGYGVDDIRIMTQWSYRQIAEAFRPHRLLGPWRKLAEKRARELEL